LSIFIFKEHSKEEWVNSKDKIKQVFENQVFGVRSIEKPENLQFRTISETVISTKPYVLCRETEASFENFDFKFKVFLGKGTKKPMPAFIYIMHPQQSKKFNINSEPNNIFLPVINIVKKGFAIGLMETKNIADDFTGGEKSGIFKVLPSNPDNGWAVLSAWAWGASRILDYFETIKEIDHKKVAVVGHSRSGKTALWASATDQRFYMAIANCSGCTGASLSRGNNGESIKYINETFPYWFTRNYNKYNDNVENLPIDQHMLLALTAPRYLYISSASKDNWADPDNELFSCHLANQIYSLYGKRGLVIDENNEFKVNNDKSYNKGCIAYHRKEGEHCINAQDWDKYLQFFKNKLLKDNRFDSTAK